MPPRTKTPATPRIVKVEEFARSRARILREEQERAERERATRRIANLRRIAGRRPVARGTKPRGIVSYLGRVSWPVVARAGVVAALAAVCFAASYVGVGAIVGNGANAIAEPDPSASSSPSPSDLTVAPTVEPSAGETPNAASAPVVTPRDPKTAGLWGPAPTATDTYSDATGCCLPSPLPQYAQYPSDATFELIHTDSQIHPVWSPVRDEVALMAGGSDGREDFVIYDAETRNTQTIASFLPFGWYPVFTWSPDGQYVAVVTGTSYSPTYFAVFSRSGGDPVIPFTWIGGDAYLGVDWSPDGQTLAIGATSTRNDNTNAPRDSRVYLVDLATGERTDIIDGAFPSFSPDGGTLAFFRDEGGDGSYGVWTVRLADGALTQISGEYPFTAFDAYVWNMETRFTPAWSADGSRLAFVSPRPDAASLSSPNTSPRLCATFVANSDGSGFVEVSNARASAPAWLPSGDLLAGSTVFDGATLQSTTRTTAYVLHGRGLEKSGGVPSNWRGSQASLSPDGKYTLVWAQGPGYVKYGWYVATN